MPITPTTPIDKPAVEAKTFDQMYLKRLMIMSSTPLSTRVDARLVPLNSTTGETDDDSAVAVTIANVQEAAATNPLIAQAMGALFAAIESYAKNEGII